MTAIGNASILIIATAVNADFTFSDLFLLKGLTHSWYCWSVDADESIDLGDEDEGSQRGGENTHVGHSMHRTSY